MRKIIIVFMAGVVIFSALYLARSPLLRRTGQFVMLDEPAQPSDAVVVFNGTLYRGVLEAADLYRERKAPRIVLFRERKPDGFDEALARGAKVAEIFDHLRAVLLDLGVPKEAVTIYGPRTESTRQEIDVARRFGEENPRFKRLIFIARRPQTRRAKRLLLKNLPSSATFTVQASRYDRIRPSDWWKDTWYLREVAEEFMKNVYALLPLPAR